MLIDALVAWFTFKILSYCYNSCCLHPFSSHVRLTVTPLYCVPAFSVAHWEQLQQEKEGLERRFEAELQGLQVQQQRELGALEERLKAQHMDETQSLQAQQRAELKELRFTQQEQVRLARRLTEYELPGFVRVLYGEWNCARVASASV